MSENLSHRRSVAVCLLFSAFLLASVSTARADLAHELNAASFYAMEDPLQMSPFEASPSSVISDYPGYAWVSGLRNVLISSSYGGVVENLTLQVYSATGSNYAPTRIGLDTGNRTALYQFSQAITEPEKILIVASEGGDKAYFRLDILPGNVTQSGMVNTDDIAYEDWYVNPPPTDPYWIAYFDLNGDGVADLNDENFIQARIDAGKTMLPDQPINVPEPSTAWLLGIAAASVGAYVAKRRRHSA
jgi:hypothetical protein